MADAGSNVRPWAADGRSNAGNRQAADCAKSKVGLPEERQADTFGSVAFSLP